MATASRELKRKVAVRAILIPPLLAAILFLTAGTFRFWQAWMYLAALLIPMTVFMLYYLKHDPEMLERRLKMGEKERSQKALIALSYPVFLASFILPGLDHRFGWSSTPPVLSIAAVLVVLAGYALFVIVMRENSYASRVIEVADAQRVISTGPYAVVRHPMYVANVLIYLASPLALGSFWAFLPAALTPAIMVVRILSEEKVLKEKLPGYADYLARVKFRLIPGIW